MSFKIFLDTEFTDFIDTQLISLGMVTDSGDTFYAEIPYMDDACSAFVREAVIPLLGQVPNSQYAVDDLGTKILTWLEIVHTGEQAVDVCFDYQTDWDLFSDVLEQRVPEWCRPRNVKREISEVLRYEFHKNSQLPMHHALYDALGNRYAFRERNSVDE